MGKKGTLVHFRFLAHVDRGGLSEMFVKSNNAGLAVAYQLLGRRWDQQYVEQTQMEKDSTRLIRWKCRLEIRQQEVNNGCF